MVVNTIKSGAAKEALIWVTRVVEELVSKIRQLREDGAVGPSALLLDSAQVTLHPGASRKRLLKP
jgi:hypothetical protein